MTIDEMRTRRIECQKIIRATQIGLMTARGLSLDDGTDAQWDEIAAIIDATVPEASEMRRLTLEIERDEQAEIASAAARRKPPQRCPRCNRQMTAAGKCDDCDDWDS